uniref:ATPase AAA-type core domain-containing protein n=1 Tax=viral metagenome TaxID=1070528 RepID=A0A6C0B6X9_9ZZZZ
MTSLGELLKMSMLFQVLTTTGNSFRPLIAFLGISLYERGLSLYPWFTNIQASFQPLDSNERKPSAVIQCERGSPPQTKNGSIPLFMTRMDAIIHYVACSPATKRLLSIANHDYLPYEFDSVRLDEDIYFKLTQVDVDDGNIKNIKFQIFCYNHPIQTLQKFVDSCNQDYERRMLNKLGNDLYFFDQMVDNKKRKTNQNPLPNTFLVYTKHKFSTTRTFENVYFEQQPEVKKRVNFFLEKRSWYERKGIPYTLGFLFHGDPGTGKTSEIKAIANVARRHPVNIQLSEIKTKTQLRHLFFSDDIHVYNGTTLEKYTIPISERVYIIEDADAMGDVLLKREWKRPEPVQAPKDPFAPEDDDVIKDPIDLSFLLNLLDGTLESSGRIMVFTSNFPERFDRALIRPGRIDMIVHFKKCSRTVLKEMIKGFYDIEGGVTHPMFDDPAMDEKWSPAEVNQILFRNFENSGQAMDELHTLEASTPLLQEREETPI